MTLEIRNLGKRYGDKTVVDGVSLTVREGQAFGLLGGNGAGKTTTIRSVLGLLEYEQGEVLWNGKNFAANRPSIGYLPEERGLYPKETVSEQLLYLARLEGMKKAAAQQALKGWLERLDIAEHEHKRVEQLSKGNQQKVQIISALLHDPELVILDEPFSGLDPVNSDMLSSVVKEELARGKAMIFSSHQMMQVEQFCEDICILKKGIVQIDGRLDDIKRSYGRSSLILRSEADLAPVLQAGGYEGTKRGAGEWALKIDSEEEAFGLMRRLAQEGVPLLKFEIKEPTLHEIFIEKVGEAV
ncbi:ATP-binding cassette domain-containing protein [Saccharibacillus sp. CPCC 101409]|uniref:ABC transporter ATP-binding protein n=1 Tax=Saccharibacillus sp. CPCC 101409 TaxID=3058041 RepID=UPI002673AA6D|nr:ATP-binding cassette domain-containing protein [Saccharibacillus sp. CPCC 101409]MDO3411360.1 ATP-binding cassette domain-containing protein [Saccharibacillus sp. CPCC 101409]